MYILYIYVLKLFDIPYISNFRYQDLPHNILKYSSAQLPVHCGNFDTTYRYGHINHKQCAMEYSI